LRLAWAGLARKSDGILQQVPNREQWSQVSEPDNLAINSLAIPFRGKHFLNNVEVAIAIMPRMTTTSATLLPPSREIWKTRSKKSISSPSN
jgi:hypothetical protein